MPGFTAFPLTYFPSNESAKLNVIFAYLGASAMCRIPMAITAPSMPSGQNSFGAQPSGLRGLPMFRMPTCSRIFRDSSWVGRNGQSISDQSVQPLERLEWIPVFLLLLSVKRSFNDSMYQGSQRYGKNQSPESPQPSKYEDGCYNSYRV
jgi:hypothetical protein